MLARVGNLYMTMSSWGADPRGLVLESLREPRRVLGRIREYWHLLLLGDVFTALDHPP